MSQFHFTATIMCQGQIHLCPEFSAESLCWKYLKWPKTWFTPQQTESRNTAVFVPRWPIHSVLIWYWNTESKHSLNHHSDCKQNKAIRGNWCEFREALNLMLPRNPHQSCTIWHWTAAPNPNQLQQTHTFHSYHTLTLLCLLWRFVLLPFLFCSCVCLYTSFVPYTMSTVPCWYWWSSSSRGTLRFTEHNPFIYCGLLVLCEHVVLILENSIFVVIYLSR